MDGTFVKALVEETGKPSLLTDQQGKPHLMIPGTWKDMTPKIPTPEALVVNTLTGLVDYLKANVDGLIMANLLVHVVDPSTVELENMLEPDTKDFRRQCFLASTTASYAKPFPFGQWLDAESFTIGLMSQFVASPDQGKILALIASIKESAVRETVDNGVSQQTVTTAGGVVLVGTVPVPNPVTLAPYRTFREVEQPESLFVLRMRTGKDGEKPTAALFEADGGTWKLEAITRISAYLRDQFGTTVAVIA